VLDDPNLHTGRYGFVRFEQLARAAAGHHYHVSMAMAPLDGWFAQRGTTRLFREHRPNLSIAIHGNDHLFREMAQARTPELSTRLLAQSLRRSAAFEGRTGVQVCRVMVPPHDSCSELSARHMLRVGFEGLCLYGSYPRFFRGAGGGMQTITRPRDPLAGWFPADLTAVAPPVLLRFALESPPDDLPLRAFLGQPLIIGGHHQDLANGPEALTEAARQLNTMGDIRWMSLSDIANSSFSTCRDGDTLRVRMFSRRVQLDVPEGVGRVVIENPRLETIRELELVSGAGSGRIEIRITPRDTLSPVTIAAPAWSARPYVRRLATEGRDRTAPTVLRLRRSTAPLVQRAAASVERRLRRL
jgi:hypothetical protein